MLTKNGSHDLVVWSGRGGREAQERSVAVGLSPPQERYLARVGGLVRRATETGHGQVVFLAGGPGSGRSFWFDVVARTLTGARMMAGGFADGKYEPHAGGRGPAVSADAESLINSIAASGILLGPIGGLVGHLITVSLAARRVVEGLRHKGQGVGVYELLPGLLRTAAAEDSARPLVCLVDDADMADGSWWANLVLSFAQEVDQELPLVLVMGVNTPEELGATPRDGESGSCGVARSLLERGLAEWWALHTLSREEVGAWLAPASQELVSAVWATTEGHPGEIPGLWDSWVHRGVIRQDEDCRWRIVGDVERTLAEAGDRFNGQLAELLGDDQVDLISDVRAILACAALEGSTFTPDAIARALNWDRNDLIDLLDDHLAGESGPLREATPAEITQMGGETRTLWRYSFIRTIDRRIARVRFASAAERRSLAQRLTPALIDTYAPEQHRIAATLAALFVEAGDSKTAEHFRRIANAGSDQAILRAQARYLVSASTDGWTTWDLSRSAELLVHATGVLFGIAPYSETLEFANASAELAARAHARVLQAEALCWTCEFHLKLGMIDEARSDLASVQAALRGPGPRWLDAWTSLLLGRLEYFVGNFKAARPPTERSLKTSQEIGDRGREAFAWYQLGQIEYAVADHRAALRSASCSLQIDQEPGNREGVAASSYLVGRAEVALGGFEAARRATEIALKVNQEIGNRQGEAASRHQLGSIELKLANFEAARRLTNIALKINQEMGDRGNEASGWHQLGEIERAFGNVEGARHATQRALTISEEIGDRVGEATGWLALGQIELALGNFEAARQRTEQALKISEETGARRGEARGLRALGQIELALGNVEAARQLTEHAVKVSGEIGDRVDEASGSLALGQIELTLGNVEEARQCTERALKAHAETSDRIGEAKSLFQLGRIELLLRNLAAARPLARRALTITQEIGDLEGQAACKQLLDDANHRS